MQMEDRDASLIRVEEQLKESAKNQAFIMADLKDIFNRLERESKATTILSGDVKNFTETAKYRCDLMVKRLDDGDTLFKEMAKEMTKEKESRVQFEQEVRTSIKTIKWVFGTLATLASVLSAGLGIAQVMGK